MWKTAVCLPDTAVDGFGIDFDEIKMHWLNSYDVTVTDVSLFSRHQRQQNIIIHAERLFRGYLPP